MALADMNNAQFDTHLAGLTQGTLTEKKTSYTTTKATLDTEQATLDGKRSQLHSHQVKVATMLKDVATLQQHTDARFVDFESRISALEVS